MQSDDARRYCDCMNDIKSRIDAVRGLLSYPAALRRDMVIEMIFLQLRKTLEQIAFASLISNREKFSKTQSKFSKYWNAAELLRDLERANKDFYPKPIYEKVSIKEKVKMEWVSKDKETYLTKTDFLELYGRSGDILHARNPFAGDPSNDWFYETAEKWASKIVELVNAHTIRLYGDPNLYLVHLEDDRGFVHYVFEPRD